MIFDIVKYKVFKTRILVLKKYLSTYTTYLYSYTFTCIKHITTIPMKQLLCNI